MLSLLKYISSGEISLHCPANFRLVMFMGKNTTSVHVAFPLVFPSFVGFV